MAADQVVLRSSELRGADLLVAHAGKLHEDSFQGRVHFCRAGRDVDTEVTRVEAFQAETAYRVGHGANVAKLDEQSAPLAGEHGGEQLERVPPGIGDPGAGESQQEMRLSAVEHLLAGPWLRERRLYRNRRRGSAASAWLAEQILRDRQHPIHLDVTHHAERHLGWIQIALVVFAKCRRRDLFDGFELPNAGKPVWVLLVEGARQAIVRQARGAFLSPADVLSGPLPLSLELPLR